MRALISGQATPDDAAPVSVEEFSALMAGLLPAAPPRLAVAVSGGPDSMALAYCLKRWCDGLNIPPPTAFIVDHGLRAESAQEAILAQKNLSALGIAAEILRWEHEPIITRLHDTARKARYRLLTEACHQHGIENLLLAHQREDQAETILMRFSKGSGVGGLAGMAAVSLKDGVRIVRPFLSLPKTRLIATCSAAGLSFVTDPSNISNTFARGRLRRVMAFLDAEGLTVDRLLDLGARAGDTKQALDHYTSMLLRVATRVDAVGAISIDLEQLRSAPVAIAQRALSVCLQSIHAETYAPEHASLNDLLQALRADADMPGRTLNGCLVTKATAQAIILREPAGITEMPIVSAGDSIIWDHRWRITLNEHIGPGSWHVKPLGNPPHDVVDRLAPELRDLAPRGRARASFPGLWRDDVLVVIPSLNPTRGTAQAELLTLPPADNPCLASH